MARERIQLDNLINTRDLGGYVTEEGRTIKAKKLLRSAALVKASERDLDVLCNEYDLKTIVDFRNTDELRSDPDPKLEGVDHIWLPIFEEQTGTITREETWDRSDPLGMYIYFYKLIQKEKEMGIEYSFYRSFVEKEHSINEYKKFFDALLTKRDGSILWHCSAGKDRCGTGTIFLLKALGCSDELIYDDYLLTNEFYQETNEKMIAIAKERGYDEEFFECIRGVNGVSKKYIDELYEACDELYGGMDNFLRDKLGLDEAKINQLKAMYLD